MRLYSFTNMYLSRLQFGLQTAHVVSEMFTRYHRGCNDDEYDILQDWACNHKTIIIFDGGYSETLSHLEDFFSSFGNPYPWAAFREDPLALGSGIAEGPPGALTAVGVVLPERIYETAAYAREDEATRILLNTYALNQVVNPDIPNDLSNWEMDMVSELNKYKLAR